MSNIIALTKVLIKNNVFAFGGRKKKGKQVSTKGSVFAFILVILLCGGSFGIPSIYLLNDLLKNYNISEFVLSFVIPIGGITSIIFGVFSIISVFYFSKDSEQLLPLPIKSSELLVAKFLASLVSEYLILIMFIFPLIVGVGIGIDASALYYLYSGIICLLMPIIPSVIMAIIIMLSNKIFNFGKRKDMFMYVMTGSILIFSFCYSFGLEFFISSDEMGIISLLSGDFSKYIKFSRYLFPFFNSATYSLVNYEEFIGFASIMTFIALNIVSMFVLYFVGDKLYIKGLTNSSGNKQEKKKNIEDTYKPSRGGVMGELIRKEWLTIKRSPVFMLNVVVVNLIFPLLLAIPLLIDGGELSNLGSFIDFSNSGVLLIGVGAILLISSLGCPSASAISRDGMSARFNKALPVSLKRQLDAKVYFSMIIDMMIVISIEVILFMLLRFPVYYFVLINVPMILTLLIINYSNLLLDLRNPRLDWFEESEAVKQNFNVFLSIIMNLLTSSLFILLGVIFIRKDINIYLVCSCISVVLLVMYLIMTYLVNKYQNKLFSKVG